MSTQDDTGALIQLGHYEVAKSVLEGDGEDLDAFTNNVLLHPAFVQDVVLTVPLHGWRIVYESAGTSGIKAQQILAAPHPSGETAWVMAFRVSSEDGFATYRYDPEPMMPVRSKKDRREQLHLQWGPAHSADTSITDLQVRLLNVSGEPWLPSERDDFYIAGIVTSHEDGRAVNGGSYYAYIAGTPAAISLEPGAGIDLKVDLEPQLLDRLEPGKYIVSAVLISLDLGTPGVTVTKY